MIRLTIVLLLAGTGFAETATIWKPAPNTSWQWQLSGTVDQTVNAAVYDIDLFDNDASVVAALHAAGRRVICYVSAGTFEPWRPDAQRFPDAVKGLPVEDFEEERWLDIRRLDVLAPLIEARFDLCKSKGFDAVEPDNVDAYQNDSGFPLTAEDQLRFNRFLADAAHARGLSVGLKNDLDQVGDLLNSFDWALNEQCLEFDECETLQPFVAAGKAVFHVEYRGVASRICPAANALDFNTLLKKLDLDATRTPCREDTAAPTLAAVVNGASGETEAVAPGEIIAIYGRLLPVGLANTRVLIGGVPARLMYGQSNQVGAIVPYASEGRSQVDVQVVSDTAKSDILSLKVAASAPGVFTADATGRGQAAMINEDGSLNSAANPADPGTVVVFYATGEGATEPDGIDGQPATPPYPAPKLPVAVSIGGKEASILYAGAAPGFSGLMQLNVRLPVDSPVGSAIPLFVKVGSEFSQAGATMAVSAKP